MVERSRRRRGMYDITKTRMLLTTAVFAAVAALYAVRRRTRWCRTTAVGRRRSRRCSPECAPPRTNTLDPAIQAPDRESCVLVGAHRRLRTEGRSGRRGGQRGVRHVSRQDGDRGARGPLHGSTAVGPVPRGSPGTAPLDGSTLPTRVVCDGDASVDWAWFGLGAGMTALLAAGIAGVVLTTRRRGGIALP